MVKRISFIAVSVVLLLAASASDCFAQRHVAGQHVISAEAYGWDRYGGNLSWGRCSHIGQTYFGLTFMTGSPEACRVPATKEQEAASFDVYSKDWYASGGYLFRVVSNRARSVNLLLGGTVDMGVRVHALPIPDSRMPRVKFIYGLSPIVKFEYFPDKSFALNIQARPRLQFYGHSIFERVFYPEFGIGCSFYIL
jgi:hypothetical protein